MVGKVNSAIASSSLKIHSSWVIFVDRPGGGQQARGEKQTLHKTYAEVLRRLSLSAGNGGEPPEGG